MKLYELNWALYPRRIGIYLVEKGINDVERVVLDSMDKGLALKLKALSSLGTVPILETESGCRIRSSIAILEYLEERFPEPNMIGCTAEQRALTRELVGVADEAAQQLGIWCHKGSPVFAGMEEQSADAARFAAQSYRRQLDRLDQLLAETGGPFLSGNRVSLADCIAMATLEFAEDAYGVPLPQELERLGNWYAQFKERPSALCPSYPPVFLEQAYGLPQHSRCWPV
nr:glutathione S-transferase family protein [Pectobacterium atrosepticum]